MENNNHSQLVQKLATLPTLHQVPIKSSRMMKSLSETKLKRLNILTFINDKKEILFTKKAFKYEKEKIWRQIFQKMLEFGMVSAEKDWRYVRDVSFSNWRKRAQKRLKHLAANGHRLNMDECEFLIHDILGQTPDKVADTLGATQINSAVAMEEEVEGEEEEDNESDEYMIDSDEEDDDVTFNEMLLVPKIVFNDDITKVKDEPEETDTASLNGSVTTQTNHTETRPECVRAMSTKTSAQNQQNGEMRAFISKTTNEQIRTSIGHRWSKDSRLFDLDIENKILKNRYMKLKIFALEQSLGLDHCSEVKELIALRANRAMSMSRASLITQPNRIQSMARPKML